MRKTFAIIAAAMLLSSGQVLCQDVTAPAGASSEGGYTVWRLCSRWPGYTNDRTDDVPMAGGVRQEIGFCGIFHRWGFIGDSLCSGEFEAVDSTGKKRHIDMYEWSWGQRICALTGTAGDNYSQGGETAKGWVSHFWDNPHNRNGNIDAKADPKQVYIIAMGANDSKKFEPGDPASDIRDDDYTRNADTFCGWYAGIIQRVKSIQPDALFFVVTFPRGRKNGAPFNAVIRAMPEHFDNVYLIDLDRYAPDYTMEGIRDNFYLEGHLNPAGYELTAWMLMNCIDWTVRHNPRAFSRVGLI